MQLIDGKLIKCLVWRDGEHIEDKVLELEQAGYAKGQSIRTMGDRDVYFDYYLPKELLTGDLITVPLRAKRLLMLDQGYMSKQIFNGKETMYYVEWLLECIDQFDKVKGPSTLLVPTIPECGKIWVVEV